jgi:hypothetical protein
MVRQYAEACVPLSWPDVHLPHWWHLNQARVPVPAIPTNGSSPLRELRRVPGHAVDSLLACSRPSTMLSARASRPTSRASRTPMSITRRKRRTSNLQHHHRGRLGWRWSRRRTPHRRSGWGTSSPLARPPGLGAVAVPPCRHQLRTYDVVAVYTLRAFTRTCQRKSTWLAPWLSLRRGSTLSGLASRRPSNALNRRPRRPRDHAIGIILS